jgi:hypothetical protein
MRLYAAARMHIRLLLPCLKCLPACLPARLPLLPFSC